MLAAESHRNKLDIVQMQGPKICSGAFRSSPVAAIQVEMRELPLRIRRVSLMLGYLVNLQGHSSSHLAKAILQDCWEDNETNFKSFGWIGNTEAENVGLCNMQYNPTVPSAAIPAWLFMMPTLDLNTQQQLRKQSQQ